MCPKFGVKRVEKKDLMQRSSVYTYYGGASVQNY